MAAPAAVHQPAQRILRPLSFNRALNGAIRTTFRATAIVVTGIVFQAFASYFVYAGVATIIGICIHATGSLLFSAAWLQFGCYASEQAIHQANLSPFFRNAFRVTTYVLLILCGGGF